MGLKGAFPTIKELRKSLISIPGSPPALDNRPLGCGFSARCPFSIQMCEEVPPDLVETGDNHYAACHRHERADEFRTQIIGIYGTRTRGH
jgi:oligopeptide/dipeptide ABC transporter ATP-binding protein